MNEPLPAHEMAPTLKSGRQEYSEIDLPSVIAEYYFYELVRAVLKRIEIADPDYSTKMEFRAARIFHTLKSKSETIEGRTLDFIKEYLIYAVSSELQFAERADIRDEEFDTITTEPGPLYRRSNVQDIVHYFAKAEAIFNAPYWESEMEKQHFFGGPQWARVAHVAGEVWRLDPTEAVKLIDHIFDLEHNKGHIFDKDLSRVKRIHTSEQILDIKSDTETLTQQAQAFNAYVRRTVSEELKSDLRDISYLVGQPFVRNNPQYPILKNIVG